MYCSLIAAFYFLSSAYIFAVWVLGHGRLGNERATFPGMIRGTAAKPFVNRTLLPSLVRLAAAAIPAESKQKLDQAIAHFAPERVRRQKWYPEYNVECCLALALIYLSLLGFMMVFRNLLKALYLTPGWVADMLPVIAILILPIFFHAGTHYVYDFPALFFFTLLLLLLLRKNWTYFYPSFILAILNKETMILISLIFAIHFFSRMSKSHFYFHLLTQCGIFLLLKSILFMIYKNNPGVLFEFHLKENIYYFYALYNYGYVAAMIVLMLLIFYKYSEKHIFLRNSIIIMIPLLVLHLFFGLLPEIRVYYEIYPVLLLLICHTMADIIKVKFEVLRT